MTRGDGASIYLRKEIMKHQRAATNSSGSAPEHQAKIETRKSMNTKILSIIAAVIGSICIAFAAFVYWQWLAVIAAVAPYAVETRDGYILWPLVAGVILWALACFGFNLAPEASSKPCCLTMRCSQRRAALWFAIYTSVSEWLSFGSKRHENIHRNILYVCAPHGHARGDVCLNLDSLSFD